MSVIIKLHNLTNSKVGHLGDPCDYHKCPVETGCHPLGNNSYQCLCDDLQPVAEDGQCRDKTSK